MYEGVWEGNNIGNSRILILGESHYCTDGDTLDTTEQVIRQYLVKPEKIPFFTKIAESFGYDKSEREIFFNKIYFGNYVDELCGIADTKAVDAISGNRMKYNDELFNFVNEKQIDVIACFSKLTYGNMPVSTRKGLKDMLENGIDSFIGYIGSNKNTACRYYYNTGVDHKYCSVQLNKPLTVYAFRHPSGQGGYDSEQVRKYILKECMADLGAIANIK